MSPETCACSLGTESTEATFSRQTGHMPAISRFVRNPFRRKKGPLLPALKHLRTLSNHTGTISALVFLPDNRRLVSSSHGGTIRVWEAEKGIELGMVHHGSAVTAMVASSDGSLLVSGGADGTVAFWDVAKWTKTIAPLHKHASAVRSMSLSADSKQLATVSNDQTICIWRTSTGEVIAGPFEGHPCSILSVAFSPGTSQLATGAEDGRVRVWNLVSGEPFSKPVTTVAGNKAILALAWVGSKRLISATYKSIVILNPITGSVLHKHTNAHDGWIRSIVGYREGQCVATGSEDGRVILWDTVNGCRKLSVGYMGRNEVYAVAVSPDGRCLAGGYRDHHIRLWSMEY